jgi:hypothetical protein
MNLFRANPFAGLIGIGIFTLWVVISEITTIYIGGEIAGLFWLAFHFVINPISGLIIMVFIVGHVIKLNILWIKIVVLVACVIPMAVAFFGLTGNMWLIETLGISFQKQ